MPRPCKPRLAPIDPTPEAERACVRGSKTIRGAAAFTGLSKSAIWELIRSGELQSFKVGRRRLIAKSQLVRYLAIQMDAAAKRSDSGN